MRSSVEVSEIQVGLDSLFEAVENPVFREAERSLSIPPGEIRTMLDGFSAVRAVRAVPQRIMLPRQVLAREAIHSVVYELSGVTSVNLMASAPFENDGLHLMVYHQISFGKAENSLAYRGITMPLIGTDPEIDTSRLGGVPILTDTSGNVAEASDDIMKSWRAQGVTGPASFVMDFCFHFAHMTRGNTCRWSEPGEEIPNYAMNLQIPEEKHIH